MQLPCNRNLHNHNHDQPVAGLSTACKVLAASLVTAYPNNNINHFADEVIELLGWVQVKQWHVAVRGVVGVMGGVRL